MQVGMRLGMAVLALLAWSERESPAQLSEMRDQVAVLAPARPLTVSQSGNAVTVGLEPRARRPPDTTGRAGNHNGAHSCCLLRCQSTRTFGRGRPCSSHAA